MVKKETKIVLLVLGITLILTILVLSVWRVKQLRKERNAKRKTETSQSISDTPVATDTTESAVVNSTRPERHQDWNVTYRDVYVNSDDQQVLDVVDYLVNTGSGIRYAEVVYAEDIPTMDTVPEIVEKTKNVDWYLEMSTDNADILTYVMTTDGKVIKDY